ncbi:MAG TPA: SOS response-associated peptidase family protein [Rhizomicrobium sp.]|jgi:putative SOS response-associated peptidase YedK
MCGKFTQMMSWKEVHDLSELTSTATAPDEIVTVTPMRMAKILRLDASGTRELVNMRWGWAGRGAKDPTGKPEFIHARIETLDVKPTFRDAFLHGNRGIAVVTTFNEGEEISPSKTRQHVITPRDGKPVAIAVLWERWTNRNEGELLTFVMVTTPPNRLISKITERMPAVLGNADWSKWLGEERAGSDELKAMLKPFEGDWDMQAAGKPPPPPKPAKANSQPDLF